MLINKCKTIMLMTCLAGILMLFGYFIAGSNGLTIACIMALTMNGVLYFFSDKIILTMYQARPFDSTKYPDIDNMVHSLSQQMGIPMPKLWLMTTPVANAFATGRNPQHSSIVFTTGILQLLDPHEIRGVIAHELSHIYNRDILITTIAATLATAIGYLANMLQHRIFFESIHAKSSQRRSTLGVLATAVLMPFIALLIRLGISRSREYLADETGAHTCQDPLALAAALQKLHNRTEHVSFTANEHHAATASLFIVNPFSTTNVMEMFSTHPPIEKRVAALHKIHMNSKRWSL